MIKLNRKQASEVVKIPFKILYRLKSDVKIMRFNNGLNPAHHKTISEKNLTLLMII